MIDKKSDGCIVVPGIAEAITESKSWLFSQVPGGP